MDKKRIFLIVIDGLGIGAADDAVLADDLQANTLLHIITQAGGMYAPTLEALGLFSLPTIDTSNAGSWGSYGIMNERSAGNDSTVGHWEMSGLISNDKFDIFPDGFPDDIIDIIKDIFGTNDVLCNKPYSGTSAIAEYGDEHIETGIPIVYTSADSCIQLAVHNTILSYSELHNRCQALRDAIPDRYNISRVIARPFAGSSGMYYRTERRKDFSLPPPRPTMLDVLKMNSIDVISIGKIDDLFCGKGITEKIHTYGNVEAMNATDTMLQKNFEGLVFINLCDSDTLYGHRNNVEGYKRCLLEIDAFLADFLPEIRANDVVIITADHGNDPTTPSTDHNREKVPLILYGDNIPADVYLGEFDGFDHISDYVLSYFGLSDYSSISNRMKGIEQYIPKNTKKVDKNDEKNK